MEEYSSNSHISREKNNVEQPAEKKVESVVSGSTTTKKKSRWRRFRDAIVSEDSANVKSYIFMDVLIPKIKEALSGIINGATDMILYGEKRGSKKSTVSKVSYRSFYERPEREPVTKAKDSFDYDDIWFSTRGDAEAVLSAMEDIISQYGVVSVGDLYDLADISTTNYTINKYGWTSLRSAEVIRGREGYLIKLPRALPIGG